MTTILYCRSCGNKVKAAGTCDLPAHHGRGTSFHDDFGKIEVPDDPIKERESGEDYFARLQNTYANKMS